MAANSVDLNTPLPICTVIVRPANAADRAAPNFIGFLDGFPKFASYTRVVLAHVNKESVSKIIGGFFFRRQ